MNPHPLLRLRLKTTCRALASLLLVSVIASTVTAQQTPARSPDTTLQLRDGDRVVLLGSTFIERAQSYGYIEAALTSRAYPNRVEFRNLGWSGDTVFGEARAGFGRVADGFAHLKQHVLELEPTVILLNYGANESFAGRAGLQEFSEGLETLLQTLDETGARIVFLSPTPHEDLGRPLPDPAEHNRQLALYTKTLADVARDRGATFVDLFEGLGKNLQPKSSAPLTDNGLHLTQYGYWRAAPVIEQALTQDQRDWLIEIDARRSNIAGRGMEIQEAEFLPGRIRLQVRDLVLPHPLPPDDAPAEAQAVVSPRVVRVFGLPRGTFALRIDGQQIVAATSQQWAAGVQLTSGPDFEQAEALRRAIVAKNELYFHRWRPQNVTYLFGFRKHEQGNNAVEIPQFDPLVEEAEAEIHGLAEPASHLYEMLEVRSR